MKWWSPLRQTAQGVARETLQMQARAKPWAWPSDHRTLRILLCLRCQQLKRSSSFAILLILRILKVQKLNLTISLDTTGLLTQTENFGLPMGIRCLKSATGLQLLALRNFSKIKSRENFWRKLYIPIDKSKTFVIFCLGKWSVRWNWSADWKFEDWFVEKKNEKIFKLPLTKSKIIVIFDTSKKIKPERFDWRLKFRHYPYILGSWRNW